MKQCPFCAEEIQDAAIKCKHCGSMLNQPAEVDSNSIPKEVSAVAGGDDTASASAASEPPAEQGEIVDRVFMAVALVLFAVVGLGMLVKFTSSPATGSNNAPSPTSAVPATVTSQPEQNLAPASPVAPASLGADDSYEFLAAQKSKGEEVTTRAVELVTAGRMAEVRRVYKDRWNELSRLRLQIAHDDSIGAEAKANIDRALKADQAGISRLLDSYDRLYPK
jgi:hypothetical protein